MKKEIMIFNFTAEYRPLDVHNLCSRRRELHLTYETKFRRAIKMTKNLRTSFSEKNWKRSTVWIFYF